MLIAAAAGLTLAAAAVQPLGGGVWNAPAFADEFDSGGFSGNWASSMPGWVGTPPSVFDPNMVFVNDKFKVMMLQSKWKGDNLSLNGLDADCDCGFENIATSMVRFLHVKC